MNVRMMLMQPTRYGVAFWLLLTAAGCGIETGYQKVDGQWSYVTWDTGHGRRVHPLNVDAASFRALNEEDYAIDKECAFYRTEPICGADPTTFIALNNPEYAQDASHAYLRGRVIDGADTASFQLLTTPYSRDSRRIYCGTVPVDGADRATFRVVRGSSMWSMGGDLDSPVTGYGWACDRASYYLGGTKVAEADYDSFRVIDDNHAEDKNRIYEGYFNLESRLR